MVTYERGEWLRVAAIRYPTCSQRVAGTLANRDPLRLFGIDIQAYPCRRTLNQRFRKLPQLQDRRVRICVRVQLGQPAEAHQQRIVSGKKAEVGGGCLH